MEFAYALGGGSPVIKSFQIGETISTAGVPVLIGGAGQEGVVLASTTAAADMIGVAITTATLVTAQQTDNSDTARKVKVIINPDAVYKARCSGSSTAGTSLTSYTITTASTDGLSVISTGIDFTSPSLDECTVYFLTGANQGVYRKITSVTANDATITVAFPNDIAVGDTFTVLPFSPTEDQFVQLTSDLTEVDCSVAVDTNNNNFRVLDFELNGVADSYVYLVPFDSLYASGGSV